MQENLNPLLMREAIRLSAEGFPAPNPHVGCLVVDDAGMVVSWGSHQFAGGPHAEVLALREAGEKARGATLFVTLEPCHHHGRTPPCTHAILEAGIRRVVVACADPNPKASGGAEYLRSQGIEVLTGILEDEAEEANFVWLQAMRRKRPWVMVKAGVSLDGRIALPSGESQWITSDASRRLARGLRAEMGCVLVGRGTIEADDPELTASNWNFDRPVDRVVLDPLGKLDRTKQVFRGENPAWQVVGPGVGTHENQIEAPVSGDGKFDLEAMLAALWDRGVTSVLVEGGAKTIGGFFAAGMVDEVALFVAPKVLGDGPSWVEGVGLPSLSDAIEFELPHIQRVRDRAGELDASGDWWVRARLKRTNL